MSISIIRDGTQPYFVRGQLLKQLLESGQFDPPFDAFCRREFGYGEAHARALIRAFKVYETLQNAGIPAPMLPALEAHARPLSILRPAQQVEVWKQLVESGQALSLSVIRASAGRYLRGELGPEDVGDPIYPSDNEFGIPTLNAAQYAEQLDAPVGVWGAQSRSTQFLGGTLHFYTDDNRFINLLNDPTPVVNAGVAAAVEPNFSCYTGTPRAVALYRIFAKRWIARFWQSKGINIFVDLNVSPEFYEDNLLGVPAGWPSWATRGSSRNLTWTLEEYAIARQHAGRDDILFVVFGGGSEVKEAAQAHNWVYMPEWADRGKS